MNFYTVCTLPNYDASHVSRLQAQLINHYDGDVILHCYTDRPQSMPASVNAIPIPEDTMCQRQWNKIDFFGPMLTGDEPVIVMDLDWTILGNITNIIDTEISSNEFIAVDRWWIKYSNVKINGGMYKFYPGTPCYLHDVFYIDPLYWQEKYIKEGSADPPINGEQNFVYEHITKTLRLKTFPGENISRYPQDPHVKRLYEEKYEECFGLPLYVNGKLNPAITMVHAII